MASQMVLCWMVLWWTAQLLLLVCWAVATVVEAWTR